MIREPKMLPWLARKAGVPLPVARAIWKDVATKVETENREKNAGDAVWRQVREFRRQLKGWAKVRPTRQVGASWVFPVPVYQAWADCHRRVLRSTWLAWSRATRTASSRLSHVRGCG